MDDVKGMEAIEKFIKDMSPEKLMEIYELCLQQEEDDGEFYYDTLDETYG